MVAEVFQAPGQHAWPALVVALFAYTAEIYLDFSGYTDLARGLSLLLGIELPENFRHPYAARNIGEFWRRWHMTFSRFLRDYVYFPLGGSRRGRVRVYLNLLLTMLVCGLWHGASWGFVIWGLLHGLALVAHKIWRRRAAGRPAGAVAGRPEARGRGGGGRRCWGVWRPSRSARWCGCSFAARTWTPRSPIWRRWPGRASTGRRRRRGPGHHRCSVLR